MTMSLFLAIVRLTVTQWRASMSVAPMETSTVRLFCLCLLITAVSIFKKHFFSQCEADCDTAESQYVILTDICIYLIMSPFLAIVRRTMTQWRASMSA
jgi:phosphate starvation-inducible membrane PsiE